MCDNILVGIDCQSIDYFLKLPYNDNKRFYEKIFSSTEIKYSLSKARPAQHFAARFAAKEATIKALSYSKLKLNQINVLNEDGGKPIIKIDINLFKDYDLSVSLSHCDNLAIAVVVGTEKKV